MKAHPMDTHLLIPRSRSSAKVRVKYQGYISQKNGHFGGISVSQTPLVLSSANAFNLDPSKILSFGKGLRTDCVQYDVVIACSLSLNLHGVNCILHYI